jgi:sugar lactone lactonase YvrE
VWRSTIVGTSPLSLADVILWAGDIVVHPEAGKLYVASLGDGKIIRVHIEDGKQDDFVTNIAPPRQLLVDSEAKKLYWTSNSVPRIDRINLDGSGREAVLPKLPSISFGFALDPEEHCMYWLSPAGMIYCSKLDGTQHRLLLKGLTTPDGLALDLDNRKLYWTENGRISQSNLDGTAVETLVSGKTTRYSSLEIFPPPE